jgi:Beta-ketoacyl synthase, N-terminal domain
VNGRHSAFVAGIGVWGPSLPGWTIARRLLRGEVEPSGSLNPRPSPALLPPTERRRAPDTVAVALEVAVRASEMAGADPKSFACVFASAYGDLAINDYLCGTLRDSPTLTSPTKFHNSVHNAAAGYWSIGTGSMQPYTAVAAFSETFAAGLLESLTQIAVAAEPVLCVAYDTEARGPLATQIRCSRLLGLSLLMTPTATPRSVARLEWRVLEDDIPAATPPSDRAVSLAGENPMAAGLPVFEALAAAQPRTVVLATAGGPGLEIAIAPLALVQAA